MRLLWFAYEGTSYRQASRGSTSLLLLVICMFMALGAQLAVFLTRQELHQTMENITARQIRSLCYTAMDAVEAYALPEGEEKLTEVVLQPSGESVALSYVSKYSADKSFYSLEFQAASTGGSTRKLQRTEFFVPPILSELGTHYPLIYKTKIEGTEYLPGAEIYTSNEEVTVPQIDFLERSGLNPVNDEKLRQKGFSTRFYFVKTRPDQGFNFTGGEVYYGSTVFSCRGNVRIGTRCRFPDNIVFVVDKGNMIIGDGVQMDNVIIIAERSVFIEPGCKIKGVIYADSIYIQGKSEFMLTDKLVAQLSAKSFIS